MSEDTEVVEPETLEEPAPEEPAAEAPEDPWSGPCPKCGLVGCRHGHYSYTPGAGFPDLSTLRDWIGVPATSYDDDRLGIAAGAAQDQVNGNYEWPDAGQLPDGLTDVFVRLVGRTVASDGVRLGVLAADAEFGTVRLSPRDPEVTRQGGKYRKRVFA